jgi:hypothetical protein
MKADNPKFIIQKEPTKRIQKSKVSKQNKENENKNSQSGEFIKSTVQNPFEKLMRLRKELKDYTSS